MDELAKDLTIDMLPTDNLWRQIAEAIGVDGFYRLTVAVGGATVYIPQSESIIRPVRDARIKAEFNGYNHPALALKYGVTERWVRRLCGDGHYEGQVDLFESLDDE